MKPVIRINCTDLPKRLEDVTEDSEVLVRAARHPTSGHTFGGKCALKGIAQYIATTVKERMGISPEKFSFLYQFRPDQYSHEWICKIARYLPECNSQPSPSMPKESGHPSFE
jgi:hypothetical protein